MFVSTRKILIVDDSMVYRRFIERALSGVQGHAVVGHACDGPSALQAIGLLQPDVVTLDIEMPGMNGLEVLKRIKRESPSTEVIMLSSLNLQSAALTLQAIESGAFDFVLKPRCTDLNANQEQLRENLSQRLTAIANNLNRESLAMHASGPANRNRAMDRGIRSRPQVIVVGISTGGPQALRTLVSGLPSDFPVPIAIVQHMPPMFTRSLADELNRISSLEIFEATAGAALRAGQIAIAPGGRHMTLLRSGAGIVTRVNDDRPEQNCKPSVNHLFRSAANQFGGDVIAVVMTGMGNDGTDGARVLSEQGARIIAQDARSCVVYGMPRAVAEAKLVNEVIALNDLATRLTELCHCRIAVGVS